MITSLPRLQPQVQAWTSSTLDAVVWADILGSDVAPIQRADAMAVPGVARGRHLTCGTVAGLPLVFFRGADAVDTPAWSAASDGQWGDRITAHDVDRLGLEPQSLWQRMLDTVDDHLFYGESLWVGTQLSETDGRPLRMLRVPWEFWQRQLIETDQGAPFWEFTDRAGMPIRDPDSRRPLTVVYIPGAHEGICNFAQRTIRTAASLEKSAADIAMRPFRLELHQTTDITLEKSEITDLITQARSALADNGGILFTNSAVETKDHKLTEGGGDLLTGSRNAAAVDCARVVSIPAALIDATTVGASLEYATLQGRNQQWIDYGLSLYMDPITARLSMDDVVPVGVRCAFDTDSLVTPLPDPTGPVTPD
jgi:hypothetical protein